MRRHLVLLPALALACATVAATYTVDPPPSLKDLRKERAEESPDSGRPLMALAPFKDHRFYKQLHKGRTKQDEVVIVAPEGTVIHPRWTDLRRGDLRLHLHRYLGVVLDRQGYNLEQIDLPVKPADARRLAAEAGADYLLEGDIRKLNIRKKGADFLIGTAVSGYFYYLQAELDLRVVELATGKVVYKHEFEFSRRYHDDRLFGSNQRETFPKYFSLGMPWLCEAVGNLPRLREIGGVPVLTPTPTRTPPGMELKKEQGPSAIFTATPTPVKKDEQPYWINPNTGKKMDPNWKFDPYDGTPRSKFIFVDPANDKSDKKEYGRGSSLKTEPTPTVAPTPNP